METLTLKQMETTPLEYPTIAGLSDAAAALSPGALWSRIEAHTSQRWFARSVQWTVSGDGVWTPPLNPTVIDEVSWWYSRAWVAVELNLTPMGYELQEGFYRIDATVGANVGVPDVVAESYRRLAEYLAADDAIGIPGASRYTVDLGRVTETISRRPEYIAAALVNSGAADLLRPFRRGHHVGV